MRRVSLFTNVTHLPPVATHRYVVSELPNVNDQQLASLRKSKEQEHLKLPGDHYVKMTASAGRDSEPPVFPGLRPAFTAPSGSPLHPAHVVGVPMIRYILT